MPTLCTHVRQAPAVALVAVDVISETFDDVRYARCILQLLSGTRELTQRHNNVFCQPRECFVSLAREGADERQNPRWCFGLDG